MENPKSFIIDSEGKKMGSIYINNLSIDVELYYGEFNINPINAKKILNNWNDNSYLKLFNTNDVKVYYKNNILYFDDIGGCELICNKNLYEELFIR